MSAQFRDRKTALSGQFYSHQVLPHMAIRMKLLLDLPQVREFSSETGGSGTKAEEPLFLSSG